MKDIKLVEKDIEEILLNLDFNIKGETDRLDHVILLLDEHDDLVDAYVQSEVITGEVDDDIEMLFRELDEYINAG